MLEHLPESKVRRARPGRGTAVSIATHAVLVTLAAMASGGAREVEPSSSRMIDSIIFVPLSVDRMAQPAKRSSGGLGRERSPRAPGIPPVGRVDIDLPFINASQPNVDLGSEIEHPGPWPGDPAAEDSSGGSRRGGGDVFTTGVEKPAVAHPDNPEPEYPPLLRARREEGVVRVQFIVDTTGRVERGSLRVLESPSELFTHSVRRTLPRLRFMPAETRGRKVRMLVEQGYVFRIQ